MNTNFRTPSEVGGLQTIALGVGGIFTVIMLVVMIAFPDQREQALRSWLFGTVFWGGIGVGCLGLLMLQYLTGGAWGVVIRRVIEAGSRTIPLFALLFIPLIWLTKNLYLWTSPGKDELLNYRAAYLNHSFWGIRAIVYFFLLSVMAYLLNKWSMEKEKTGDWEILGKMSRFSGPTMVLFALVVSFMAIDWVMTLDPHWFSTIFGLLFVVGWGLSALAFTIAILAWLSDKEPMNRILGKRHFHDLGKLMLALVMVWAYFNFSQYLIIWSGNLPEETPWYLTRMKGGWGVMGVILIVFHFAFPFLVLLNREYKRTGKWLAVMAVFILVMRLIDLYFLIGPSPMFGSHDAGFHISWMDFAAPIGIGGIWLWWFLSELKGRTIVPYNDPFFENAVAHGKGH